MPGNGLDTVVARGSVGPLSSPGRTSSAARAETPYASCPVPANESRTGSVSRYRRTWLAAEPGGGPLPTGDCGSATSTTEADWATATEPGGGAGGAVGTRTSGAPNESKPMVTAKAPTGPVESTWHPLTETGGRPSATNRPDTSIRSGDRSAQSQDTSIVRVAAGTTGPPGGTEVGSGVGRSIRTSASTGFCTGLATRACVVRAHGPQRPCTSRGAAAYVVVRAPETGAGSSGIVTPGRSPGGGSPSGPMRCGMR